LIALVLAIAFEAAPAQAQELDAGLARSIRTLDDRANEAWLYGMHTLTRGYAGPSMAESARALGHAAALVSESERVAVALEAAGHRELAGDLRSSATTLAESTCPSVAATDWPRMSQSGFRSSMARTCETTSDLITAVRDYVKELRATWRGLRDEAPSDCTLVRLDAASSIRSAIEEVDAMIGTAHSINIPEERRELVAELRDYARRGGAPVGIGNASDVFPAELVARYHEHAAAWRGASGPERDRIERQAVALARRLAAAPNPMSASIARLERSKRALEQVLRAYRTGGNDRMIARHLASARGPADVDEVVAVLEGQLREAACAT
jgi:hypothetical protein